MNSVCSDLCLSRNGRSRSHRSFLILRQTDCHRVGQTIRLKERLSVGLVCRDPIILCFLRSFPGFTFQNGNVLLGNIAFVQLTSIASIYESEEGGLRSLRLGDSGRTR